MTSESYWSGKSNPQKEELIEQYCDRIKYLETKVLEMQSEIDTLKAFIRQ